MPIDPRSCSQARQSAAAGPTRWHARSPRSGRTAPADDPSTNFRTPPESSHGTNVVPIPASVLGGNVERIVSPDSMRELEQNSQSRSQPLRVTTRRGEEPACRRVEGDDCDLTVGGSERYVFARLRLGVVAVQRNHTIRHVVSECAGKAQLKQLGRSLAHHLRWPLVAEARKGNGRLGLHCRECRDEVRAPPGHRHRGGSEASTHRRQESNDRFRDVWELHRHDALWRHFE